KHKTRLEGGVGVPTSGEYQSLAVLILPENLNRCKLFFEQRRSLVSIVSGLPAGSLQSERRTHVFCSYPACPLATPPREGFRRRPPAPARPQRQSADHDLCPRPDAPNGEGQGLRRDH